MKFFDSDDEYPGGDSFLGVTFETTAKPFQTTTQEPRYEGGYSKLIYKLAEPLVQKGKVKLECKVTNVDYSGSSCEVTYVDLTEGTENRKPKTMRAKTVLITLPLGVLKKCKFIVICIVTTIYNTKSKTSSLTCFLSLFFYEYC